MAQSIAPLPVPIKRHFCRLLPAEVILDACRGAGHRWRRRKFDPVVTVHLFLLQVLHGNTAILHLRHLASRAVNAAAYCRARTRLPLAAYETLLDYTARLASQGCMPVFAATTRVFLIDGTSSLTPDTPSTRRLFRQPANVKPGCGYPMAKVLALFDAASGAILRPLICSLYVHEASRAWALHPLLRVGDLLVGDRAFGTYAHLAMLHARAAFGLFRAHQRRKVSFRQTRARARARAGRPHRAKGPTTTTQSRPIRKLGRLDQLVEWFKPAQKPRWMSERQFDVLPAGLVVRELRYHLQTRGQRTRVVTIVTTLLDPVLYPAAKIAELYGMRWQVETHFAQLKGGLRMGRLKCRSAQGVKRELLTCFIAYNLVRRVMRDAADRQRVPARRISFTDALRWLANAREDEPSSSSSSSSSSSIVVLVVVPPRPDRHEPRVKKYLKYRYPSMTRTRRKMKRRPHLYGGKLK